MEIGTLDKYWLKSHGSHQEPETVFSYIQTIVKKKSKMKIQVAIARKMLVTIWHMLSKEEVFIDIYLGRLEELKKAEEQIRKLESYMDN